MQRIIKNLPLQLRPQIIPHQPSKAVIRGRAGHRAPTPAAGNGHTDWAFRFYLLQLIAGINESLHVVLTTLPSVTRWRGNLVSLGKENSLRGHHLLKGIQMRTQGL